MIPKINEGDFQESIQKAMQKGGHVEYLEDVLKKYEEYKRAFEHVFTTKNDPELIYRFRANYLLKKPVWRDIEILGTQTFNDFVDELLLSVGWENDHMHGFDIPQKQKKSDSFFTASSIAFFTPYWEDDPHPTYKSDEINITDLNYEKVPKLDFIFDYGDGHRFDFIFKGTRKIKKGEKELHFPLLVDQRGVAPEQYPEYNEEI